MKARVRLGLTAFCSALILYGAFSASGYTPGVLLQVPEHHRLVVWVFGGCAPFSFMSYLLGEVFDNVLRYARKVDRSL